MAAFNFVIPLWRTTSPAASASFSPTAGDIWAVIAQEEGVSGRSISLTASSGRALVSPNTGNWPNFSDGFLSGTWNLGVQTGAAGGSTICTLSAVPGDQFNGIGFCYSGCSGIYSPSIQLVNAPGTGAGALAGTSVTVAPGDLLLVLVGVEGTGGSCTAVQASTQRLTGSSFVWHNANGTNAFEYAGTGQTFTPTFTVAVGTDHYIVIQMVFASWPSIAWAV